MDISFRQSNHMFGRKTEIKSINEWLNTFTRYLTELLNVQVNRLSGSDRIDYLPEGHNDLMMILG